MPRFRAPGAEEVLFDFVRDDGDVARRDPVLDQARANLVRHCDHPVGASWKAPVDDAPERFQQARRSAAVVRQLRLEDGVRVEDQRGLENPARRQGGQQALHVMCMDDVVAGPAKQLDHFCRQSEVDDQELLEGRAGRQLSVGPDVPDTVDPKGGAPRLIAEMVGDHVDLVAALRQPIRHVIDPGRRAALGREGTGSDHRNAIAPPATGFREQRRCVANGCGLRIGQIAPLQAALSGRQWRLPLRWWAASFRPRPRLATEAPGRRRSGQPSSYPANVGGELSQRTGLPGRWGPPCLQPSAGACRGSRLRDRRPLCADPPPSLVPSDTSRVQSRTARPHLRRGLVRKHQPEQQTPARTIRPARLC